MKCEHCKQTYKKKFGHVEYTAYDKVLMNFCSLHCAYKFVEDKLK